MAEMTPAELTGAIKALEELIGENVYQEIRTFLKRHEADGRDIYSDDMQDFIEDRVENLRAQLAAQPPAVDRERRLREALEQIQEGLHAHCNEHDEECCRICLGQEITYALADQPPPPEVIPGTLDALAALGAQRDPREAALEKAEKKLLEIWWKVPTSHQALRAVQFTDSEVAELRTIVDEIRAARGKA